MVVYTCAVSNLVRMTIEISTIVILHLGSSMVILRRTALQETYMLLRDIAVTEAAHKAVPKNLYCHVESPRST